MLSNSAYKNKPKKQFSMITQNTQKQEINWNKIDAIHKFLENTQIKLNKFKQMKRRNQKD